MRVLLVLDPAAPLTPTLVAARRVAPNAEHLHVVVLGEALTPRHAEEPLAAVFEALGVGSVETAFDPAQIAAVARTHDVSLVVLGPWPSRSFRSRALTLVELASREGFDVLSVGARCAAAPPRSGRVGFSIEPGSTAMGPTTAAVRALDEVSEVTVFVRGELTEELEPSLQALVPGRALELVKLTDVTGLLEKEATARGLELLVVASSEVSFVRQVLTGLAAAETLEEAAVPLLLLHRGAEPVFVERLSVSDLVRTTGPLRVAVERVSALGRSPLAKDEPLTFVGQSGALTHSNGVLEVPAPWLPAAGQTFGIGAGTLVATARVLPDAPLVLLDASFPLEQLADVEVFARDHHCVLVRLRADETLESLRTRFDAASPWGTPFGLLDASAWLDDGGAIDVPQAVDAIRLLRLATRLVADGVNVAAIVTADPHALHTDTFVTWTASELRTRSPSALLSRPAPCPQSAEARWSWLTGAPLVQGHAVTLALENGAERDRLLDAIEGARTRVHWQSYIVEDDATVALIAEALTRAAQRGVEVRVLVDALYSRHDAFGTRNPVLERLAAVPHVEVRGVGRLEGFPSLADLKQRNHRKLVVVDGTRATLSGRNLGATYYRGFGDVELTAQTPYRDVPWLDASVALAGPLVAAAEQSFLDDWRKAGGEAFDVPDVSGEGTLACRLVRHEGLLDGRTLEAQLELVDTARARVVLVNTFPLVLELQRALLRAVARGVKVQFLFGNVRPRWGEDQPFVGGAFRELADELVRSRLDPVLRAGAEGYEFALPHRSLGRVFPHVHAKLYTRDLDLVAVGSANLDVTSAYWESEALLLVEDAAFARDTVVVLDGLLEHSRRVDVHAPSWASTESRRDWLSRNWPSLMG